MLGHLLFPRIGSAVDRPASKACANMLEYVIALNRHPITCAGSHSSANTPTLSIYSHLSDEKAKLGAQKVDFVFDQKKVARAAKMKF